MREIHGQGLFESAPTESRVLTSAQRWLTSAPCGDDEHVVLSRAVVIGVRLIEHQQVLDPKRLDSQLFAQLP